MNQNPKTNDNDNVEEKINDDSQNLANAEPKGENTSGIPYGFGKQFVEQKAENLQQPYNTNAQQSTMPSFNQNAQRGATPPFNPNGQPYQQPYNFNGQPFGYTPVNANGQPAYSLNNQPQKQGGEGMSIAGFVIGLASLFCCCLTPVVTIVLSVLGLVFSILGVVFSKKAGKVNGLAIAGIVISAVSLLFWSAMLAFSFYLREEGILDIFNQSPEYEKYM